MKIPREQTREQLIERAILESIDALKQVGCTYTVTDTSGRVYTNVVERKRRNDFSALNITERLLQSSIGEEVFFQCPDGIEPMALQSAVCGHAFKVFGSDNYRTAVDRERRGVIVLCGRKRGINLAALSGYSNPEHQEAA
jgi:hypothetical protein